MGEIVARNIYSRFKKMNEQNLLHLVGCLHFFLTKRPLKKNMCFQGAQIYEMAEDIHVPNFVLFLSLGSSVFVWSHFSTPPTLLLYF